MYKKSLLSSTDTLKLTTTTNKLKLGIYTSRVSRNSLKLSRFTHHWVSCISTHRVSIRPSHLPLDTVSRHVLNFRLVSRPSIAIDLQSFKVSSVFFTMTLHVVFDGLVTVDTVT